MVNAPFGQIVVHLPHLIHLETSTDGALKTTCVNACFGQAKVAGHL